MLSAIALSSYKLQRCLSTPTTKARILSTRRSFLQALLRVLKSVSPFLISKMEEENFQIA